VTTSIKRCRGDKKYVLRLNEPPGNIVDHGSSFAHDYS
jgi:hypothetical protein